MIKAGFKLPTLDLNKIEPPKQAKTDARLLEKQKKDPNTKRKLAIESAINKAKDRKRLL
jgi:hypothetical protein